jgi:lipopolysaccharide export system protein LptA
MGWGHRKYIGCLAIASLLLLPAGAIAETTAAKAPAAPNPLGDKYDTKLPVEISSDTLEVLQQQNKAIFKGNVIAVQGKIRLNADTMIVHYKQKSDQPGQPASPAQPAPAGKTDAPGSSAQGSMGAISLIEVEGNVFMATPEESAKGDKGNYQVDEKLLHLTGDNDILTRG